MEAGTSTCATCGTGLAGPGTAPLGSPEPPLGSGTLVLGSGVPIEGPLPHLPERSKPARPPVDARPKPRAGAERRPRIDLRKRLPPVPLAPPTPEGEAPAKPRKSQRRRILTVVGGLVALLAVASAVLWLRSRPGRLSAEARFDRLGSPELVVHCRDCADGTLLRLGSAEASVQNGSATLRVDPPMTLGKKREEAELLRPGSRRAERERLDYEVDFVVSPDLRGLAQASPKLSIVAEARADVAFIVEGRVVPPGENGLRRYDIDIRAEVTGPAKESVVLERQVPYLVKRDSGELSRGELALRTEIVPLMVEAPGESIVIETASFVLAGVTQRDGTISVEGRPITVDPTGRFAQLMSVSAVGDTTISVRASAPGKAPRLFPIRVRRVASLKQEAESFARRAESSFAAIVENADDKRGWAVALDGKVLDVRSDGYTSSVLLDVAKGCALPPCTAQLKVGERSTVAKGASITAYGYLAGKARDESSGHDRVEVRVEFLRGRE